ncbi:MAG TPA: NAD(P)-binding domain-containing protein [Ferruginibacter sp.]|nr:DNA-binding protein [Chitinophagaceae bacterium]HRI23204.1 NAD(P)-binding domain-containing protein [Ferruginibacter sp.]
MKVAILGSGQVGRVLGSAFLKEGHLVMLGTRDVNKAEVKEWLLQNPGSSAGSFADCARFGEIIVLAVSGDIAAQVISSAGISNFDGKPVIDPTNPIDHTRPPVNGVLPFFTSGEESLMERLQKMLPGAKLVKAFNSVGSAYMYKPDFGGEKPTMFICGNDEAAKSTVKEILDSFGWETEDMGKAEAARPIESLCVLWCLPGFIRGQWAHAFRLLKK